MKTATLSGPISAASPRQGRENVRAFLDARAALLAEEDDRRMPLWFIYVPVLMPGAEEAAAESAALMAAGRDHAQGPLYQRMLRQCFDRILKSDVLFVLPGWRESTGARREATLAAWSGVETRHWHPDPRRRGLVDA